MDNTTTHINLPQYDFDEIARFAESTHWVWQCDNMDNPDMLFDGLRELYDLNDGCYNIEISDKEFSWCYIIRGDVGCLFVLVPLHISENDILMAKLSG